MYQPQPADATVTVQPCALSSAAASANRGSIRIDLTIPRILDSGARIPAKIRRNASKCVISPASYCCQKFPPISGNARLTRS